MSTVYYISSKIPKSKILSNTDIRIVKDSKNNEFLDDKGNVTPTTGLLVNVLSSLSEFFYHQNREKTLLGIELAKKQGKYKGRQPNSKEDIDKYMNKPKTKKMLEMLKQGNSVRSIVRILECSPNSIYKFKKLSQNVLN